MRLRFSRQDWIALGLRELAKQGPPGLTIDALCAAAARTRGSFYHHFEGHDDFIDAMMRTWKQRDTDAIIQTVDNVAQNKTALLNDKASRINHRLEGRIRQLAQQNKVAARWLKIVDAARIAFLEMLHETSSGVSRDDSKTLAKLDYAALVGAQTLWPNASATTMAGLGASFSELIKAKYGGSHD
ncbi:MAG: TetR/AcrR family transcriptional regulator [Pseudomonadota bacterium]